MASATTPVRGFLIAVIALFFLFDTPSALRAESESDFSGHWEGAIKLPNGELGVLIDLAFTPAEGWTGTIDIPLQGATGLPLTDFVVSESDIRFSIQGVPGEPTFDGHHVGDEILGKFRQGDAELDFKLGRESISLPSRPQEPKPPFPYDSEEVTFGHGDISLAGTLTLPEGNGPFPAAVLITGSGPQDRDESLLGHKPFLVLADHLTRAGIAVLRSDDRGVGGSTGSVRNSTSADFAEDAIAAVEFLADRTEIAADRIGLIGHSEGGMVAPLAVVRGADVAYLVHLAGPGVPTSQLLPKQAERVALASGTTAEAATSQAALIRELFDVLEADLSENETRERLTDIGRRQIALQDTGDEKITEQEIEEEISEQMEVVLTPWFRYFAAYDPGPVLSKIEVPVLALNGELDTQVDAKQNLGGMEVLLAHNKDVTLVSLPGLNHLFQHAETGSPAEYASIEETFAPEVLELISQWILERFGSAPGSED